MCSNTIIILSNRLYFCHSFFKLNWIFILTGRCKDLSVSVYMIWYFFHKRNGKMFTKWLRAVLEIMFMWSCTYIHSLATFLGTPCLYRVGSSFSFRTALILRGIDSTRCWKHSSEILVYIDMIASRSCCRFVGCTSMMWISRSTTSQSCSIRLRSGDCGGHLSKINSLSCSRNQSEMIWSLWHGALSCWK